MIYAYGKSKVKQKKCTQSKTHIERMHVRIVKIYAYLTVKNILKFNNKYLSYNIHHPLLRAYTPTSPDRKVSPSQLVWMVNKWQYWCRIHMTYCCSQHCIPPHPGVPLLVGIWTIKFVWAGRGASKLQAGIKHVRCFFKKIYFRKYANSGKRW